MAFITIFFIDQYIKQIFLNGFIWHSDCISLILVFNKGVAFSMLDWLGDNLKYLQILVISSSIGYLIYEKDLLTQFTLPFGMLFGAGVSNLYDRFVEVGVVDYVYWHCGFDFAIFNFADVMIDLSIGIILLYHLKEWWQEKKDKNSD